MSDFLLVLYAHGFDFESINWCFDSHWTEHYELTIFIVQHHIHFLMCRIQLLFTVVVGMRCGSSTSMPKDQQIQRQLLPQSCQLCELKQCEGLKPTHSAPKSLYTHTGLYVLYLFYYVHICIYFSFLISIL